MEREDIYTDNSAVIARMQAEIDILTDKMIEYNYGDCEEICEDISQYDNEYCERNCNNFCKECVQKWLEVKQLSKGE